MGLSISLADPNTFASASLDGSVKLWSLDDDAAVNSIQAHDSKGNCVEYFPTANEPLLVSGSDDKTVKVCRPMPSFTADLILTHL